MKRKNSLGLFGGLALGLASIYALTLYFGLPWAAVKGFMLSTLLLLAAMFVIAAILVGLIKLIGKLMAKASGNSQQDVDNDNE
jgi:uncharacterized membrane protein